MRPSTVIRTGFEWIENRFDRVFGPDLNPMYHLGTLGFFFYWIVAVSGVYVYIFFDTGVTSAFESVEYMTEEQWYAAGLMRSLHRYASDAMVVVILLHLLREWVMGRFRGTRWLAWVTGVPLLWFLYFCGISGYWVVWDKLAQYIAVSTTEWLDTLGIFGEPIARNFLNEATLGGRFFTLMVFMHIVVPLFMLFMMWIHIQRVANPRINPRKGLAIGTLASLTALSVVKPAVSQGPANLDVVPAVVNLDWFYLPLYPLLDHMPGIWLWSALIGVSLFLVIVPWLPPRPRQGAVAVVDLANCNGCARCEVDCPYNAIQMAPRSDARSYAQEAVVIPSLCMSCGICVGACPTATPYRRASDLIPGIDLPEAPMRELRERSIEAAKRIEVSPRVLVYGCGHGPNLKRLEGPGVAVLQIECAAMLPPAFLDFVLSRGHADGVFLTGCREEDCFHRLGVQWTQERIARERDPYLRERVPRERIATCWSGRARGGELARELAAFRERLAKQSDTRQQPGEKRSAVEADAS